MALQPPPKLKPLHITTRSPSPAPLTPAAVAASPVAAVAAVPSPAAAATASTTAAAAAPASDTKLVVRRFFATKECTKSAPIVATQSEVHSWTGGSTIVSVDDDPRAPLDPLQEDRSCEACGNDIDEILVTCKKCRVRVHPSCVGVNPDKLPGEGRKGCPIPPFTCLPCSRGVAPTCELCGLKGGPLKPTERGGWGHIPCAWQVPELWFRNAERVDIIEGFDYIPKQALHRTCSICNKKLGICVQCYATRSKGKRCATTFHVGYAKRDPQYRVEMIYAKSIVCFCADHIDAPFNESQWAAEQRRGMALEQSDPEEYWRRVKAGEILEASRGSSSKQQKKTTGSKKKGKGGSKQSAAAAAPAASAATSSKRNRSESVTPSAAASSSSTRSKSVDPTDRAEASPSSAAASSSAAADASRKKSRSTMNSAATAAEVAAAEAAAAAALAESSETDEDEEEESSAGYLARLQHTKSVMDSTDMLDDGWGESTQQTTAAASSSSSSAAAAVSGGFESNLHKLLPLHSPSLSLSRGRSTGSEFDTLAFVARQELSPRVQQMQQEHSRAASPSLSDPARSLGSPLMMHRAQPVTGDFITPIRSDRDRDSSSSSSSHLLNLHPPPSLSHSLASASDKSALQSPPSHLSTPSWFNESLSKLTPTQQQLQMHSSETTPSSVHSTSLSSALKSLGASLTADSPAQFGTPSAAAAASSGRALQLSPIHDASMIGATGEETEDHSSNK